MTSFIDGPCPRAVRATSGSGFRIRLDPGALAERLRAREPSEPLKRRSKIQAAPQPSVRARSALWNTSPLRAVLKREGVEGKRGDKGEISEEALGVAPPARR